MLSVLDWEDSSTGGVVADGRPVVRTPVSGNMSPRVFDDPAGYPSVALFDSGFRAFQANHLWSGPPPKEGQNVLIAGYMLNGSEGDLSAFFELEPTFVSARILDDSAVPGRRASRDLIWIAAPAGDYEAFRGGPVGVPITDAPARVLGVVLFQQSELSARPGSDAILAVGLVPVSLRGGEP
jgi:hypothetical protein